MSNTYSFLGLGGNALSIPEVSAITCSLLLLAEQQSKKCTFWGKVMGYSQDYLVAQAKTESFFELPTNFYSVDGGVTWTLLQPLTEEQIQLCEQLRGPFMGKPDFLYKSQKELPPPPVADTTQLPVPLADADTTDADADADADAADPDADPDAPTDAPADADNADADANADADDKKPVKKAPKFIILTLPEAARLHHFIKECDAHCRIVPRGAFLRKDDGVVCPNKTYRGLSFEQSTKLSNYFKLKTESVASGTNQALFKDSYLPQTDFLTSIVHDMPKGSWSLKVNRTLNAVALSNLTYEGSLFVAFIDSNEYQFAYFGRGERNLNLNFMLP